MIKELLKLVWKVIKIVAIIIGILILLGFASALDEYIPDNIHEIVGTIFTFLIVAFVVFLIWLNRQGKIKTNPLYEPTSKFYSRDSQIREATIYYDQMKFNQKIIALQSDQKYLWGFTSVNFKSMFGDIYEVTRQNNHIIYTWRANFNLNWITVMFADDGVETFERILQTHIYK